MPLLLLTFYFLFSQSKIAEKFPCEKYRKGDFYYHIPNSPANYIIKVQRNDTLQIETAQPGGVTARLKVNWIGECTFELQFIDGSLSNEKSGEIAKKLIVHTTILEGTDKYYISMSTNNMNGSILTDTMWIAH